MCRIMLAVGHVQSEYTLCFTELCPKPLDSKIKKTSAKIFRQYRRPEETYLLFVSVFVDYISKNAIELVLCLHLFLFLKGWLIAISLFLFLNSV